MKEMRNLLNDLAEHLLTLACQYCSRNSSVIISQTRFNFDEKVKH